MARHGQRRKQRSVPVEAQLGVCGIPDDCVVINLTIHRGRVVGPVIRRAQRSGAQLALGIRSCDQRIHKESFLDSSVEILDIIEGKDVRPRRGRVDRTPDF